MEFALRRIRYLSTCAGSGKTYAICIRVTAKVLRRRKILIVQLTIELISQTVATLRSLNPTMKIKIFHKETIDNGVSNALHQYLSDPGVGGRVVITTWAAYISLDEIPHADQWDLYVDELPQAVQVDDLSIPREHTIITQYLHLMPYDNRYALLLDLSKLDLIRIYKNKSDDIVWKLFRELIFCILSPHYETFVLSESFERLIRNRGADRKLTSFSILQPSTFAGFRSVLLSGARLEETLLYRIWTEKGVVFKEDRAIKKLLRYGGHSNGSLMTFYFATDRRWSKTTAQSKDNDIVEQMIEKAVSLFDNQPFLYLANKDCKKTQPLTQDPLAQQLPGYSHGLNNFQHYRNVLITAAYNYMSSTTSFIRDVYKVSEVDQRIALMSHQFYQAVNRCSIRDRSSILPVKVIVPDLFSAEWCASVFPGSTVAPLEVNCSTKTMKLGRKARHSSPSARNRASYNKIKHEKELANRFLNETGMIVRDEFPFGNSDENPL